MRPFRIVGVRDCEVEDKSYPTRIEADYKLHPRPLRNRFQAPNFISLWIDELAKAEAYLKQQEIPYGDGKIEKDEDGHSVLVIPPTEDGKSIEFFNLSGKPAMVELVQATEDVIQQWKEDNLPDEEPKAIAP